MRAVAAAFIVLLSVACSESDPLSLSLRNNEPELQPLHDTQYSSLRDMRRMLIRDADTWSAVWAEMVNVGDPKTPPFVDFTREDVVVAAMGERHVSGYAIVITSIEHSTDAARITVTSSVPGPTCDRAEVISSPLSAVRVRKLTAPLSFDERTLVRVCN